MTTTPITPTTIDLAGLPEPVANSIRQLVESLRAAARGDAPPRVPLLGRFAVPGLSIPKEDIDEAQREMWANFPREFPEPVGWLLLTASRSTPGSRTSRRESRPSAATRCLSNRRE